MTKSVLVTVTVPRMVAESAIEQLSGGIVQLEPYAKFTEAQFALSYLRAVRDNLREQLDPFDGSVASTAP